jgi:soluble lytic murein transglycosylase
MEMNRCLRSLSCLITVGALALFATEATAKTNPRQVPPKQQPPKKPQDAKKEAPPPQRKAAAGKHRPAKHANVKKKSKQAKDASPPKDTAKETVKETAKETA